MKKTAFSILFALIVSGVSPASGDAPPGLEAEQTSPVWIFFTDRAFDDGQMDAALAKARTEIPERALKRRAKTGTSELDEKDLPVYPPYIDAVRSTGAKIRTVTRYFNGVSADVTLRQAVQIAELPFVRKIQPVAGGWRNEPLYISGKIRREIDYDYGESYTQLEQINVPAMHNKGFTGRGVLVCMLDTGCNLEHIAFRWMDLLAARDFINDDSVVVNEPGDPERQHDHGTFCLSACGGYTEGELYGPAFEATFIFGKTEIKDDEIPIEEDYYVEGLEWADSLGADVVSTSLGYFDWYEFSDLDGNTCVSTVGMDIAASRGIVCCTAAGNERNSDWEHIIAPADADSVIAVGAVNGEGELAEFSSPGPTYDGRIKPEVCAMGVDVRCADPDDIYGFTNVGGTSLSTPLVGGVAALLIQAHPNWDPVTLREALKMTASQSSLPDNDYGWGIIDALAAAEYSFPPVIESRSPGADTVVVVEDSLAEFSVYAVDEDGDPIVYSLVVGDSVWAENETGTFEIVFPEPDTLNIAVFARDLIQFADSTSWVVIVQNQAVVRGNSGTPPADFGLSAYPNPFNSRTVLSFELRAARKVELAVYDIMGREVAVLANGYRDAGNYEIDFDGTNLPSGLYFARLTAGDFRTSQKLLLIK